MSVGIDRDKWLAALQSVEPTPDPDALCIQELAALLQCGERAARRRADQLLRAGKATRTTKRFQRITGDYITVTAYRLVKES